MGGLVQPVSLTGTNSRTTRLYNRLHRVNTRWSRLVLDIYFTQGGEQNIAMSVSVVLCDVEGSLTSFCRV